MPLPVCPLTDRTCGPELAEAAEVPPPNPPPAVELLLLEAFFLVPFFFATIDSDVVDDIVGLGSDDDNDWLGGEKARLVKPFA